jgi:hypothetical protein
VAEALRASVISKGSSSRPGTVAKQDSNAGGAAGNDDDSRASGNGTGASASAATAPSNPALVECAVCHRKPGDPGVPATLKLCGSCQRTRYCSTECQRRDWKLGHKEMCKFYQAVSKAAARMG